MSMFRAGLNRLKAMFSSQVAAPGDELTSLDPVIQGLNPFYMNWLNGAKPRPFNYDAAVLSYTSWVYACANLNAKSVSSVPLRMYVKGSPKGSQKTFESRKIPKHRRKFLAGDMREKPSMHVMKMMQSGDWEELTGGHPALKLLARPNPYFMGVDFIQLLTLYLDLIGNAFFATIMSGEGGFPVSIYPLMSQWVRIKPGVMPGDPYIIGYRYGPQEINAADFNADELVHIRTPNPCDPYYGRGKCEADWAAITLNMSNHTMDLAFADNNARPDYVAIVESAQAGATLDRIEEKINKVNRGVRNAGRMLAINGKTELKALNFMPKDLAGRESTVEEIAAGFGVPVSMLLSNDPNKAAAETGFNWYCTHTVNPLCRLIEAALSQNYLKYWGDDVAENSVLAFDDAVPRDDKFALEATSKNVELGIISRNEARAENGLEAVDGGDDLVIETRQGTIPLDMVRPFAESLIKQQDAAAEATANPPQAKPGNNPPKVDAPDDDANTNLPAKGAA